MKNTPEFHLLGPFQAQKSCGTAINFGHRKVLALLAYLAVEHERPHTREYLASLLWARTGDDRARHNLRQALSKLRQLCPDLIQTSADLVRLNRHSCSIDVLNFSTAVRSDDIDALKSQLELYRGDLLEGYVAREADYQNWLEAARLKLLGQASDTAQHLADLLIQQQRDSEAIQQLNWLLRFDQANESAHRGVMQLLARNGRRSEALRQYQTCVNALARELDVEPSLQTVQLMQAIKAGNDLQTADNGSITVDSASTTDDKANLAVLALIDFSSPEIHNEGTVLNLARQKVLQPHAEILHIGETSMLIGFREIDQALEFALKIQHDAQSGPGDAALTSWRIGIDSGVVVRQRNQWQGDSLIMAQRLAALVPVGSICISANILDATALRQDLECQFIGEHRAYQVDQPIKAYRLRTAQHQSSDQGLKRAKAAFDLPGKPSLLLIPFDNISNDSEQDYFVEGLTKDISIALTKIPGLFLAADETPRARFSQGKSITALGLEFGVRYILCGSVRRHAQRVRVNAELIDAETGQCIWGERYDRDLSDLFTIQDEITEEIVTAMDVKLIQGEAARFMRQSLTNPAALEMSYRAWYALYHGTGRQDVLEAQRLFEQVIQLEPQSALGYASAALAYWAEAGFGRVVHDSAAMQHAAELARKALELGDTTGYANLILALEHLAQREFDEALSQITEGVAARPNCNGAYAIKSSILNFLGRPREAIEFAQYAVRLTPVYPAEFPAVLAACYHDSGRYQEAVDAAEMSLQLRADDIDPMLMLIAAKVALGDLVQAREVASRIMILEPQFNLRQYAATQPYQDRQKLDRLIERLRQAGLPEG